MSGKASPANTKREILRYRGSQIVLNRKDPQAVKPGATVYLDVNGDGSFEHSVRADKDGSYTFCLNASQLPPNGEFSIYVLSPGDGRKSDIVQICAIQEHLHTPAGEVPVNYVPGDYGAGEPEICTCAGCPDGETITGSSLDAYTHSLTPVSYGVELATGKLRERFPIASFQTRLLGFSFAHKYASLVKYDGPWGQGFSHSFNMMIVQTGELSGQIVTPDLRIYHISSDDGVHWHLPRGFFSNLVLDRDLCRWRMTHFSGLESEFFLGVPGRPGYPISIREPNGNVTRLVYDNSGLLQRIVTDLDQVQTFAYDGNGMFRSFTDHIQRSWRFNYDDRNRLVCVASPVTEFADIAAGREITDRDLKYVLAAQPRTMKLAYTDERFPNHITSVTDQRGATPIARIYDTNGRVKTALINGKPLKYRYNVSFGLPKLEEANVVTRVVDREGNVTDHEIHGPQGGPVKGRGRFGLRRKVTWTERGKGNAPLRESEPAYWEQRWLHDCKCLSPKIVVQPFSSEDAQKLVFDELGIPGNWPRTIYSYNRFRQVIIDLYTDGAQSIRSESAYQENAFGENKQYSRVIRTMDPRAFDNNPIYAGLNFDHHYRYDERGNRLRHDAPTVSRGVDAPQSISSSWVYNRFGQVLQRVDPDGNVTIHTYYEGASSGGDINTKGEFGGYLAATTVGAPGSKDAPTELRSAYRVNPLGMVTQETNPNGFIHDIEYNDLQERTRWIEPAVSLRNGMRVRYETRCIYDGAGNKVMERRSNIDLDGSVPANAWIDRSMNYDAVNNLRSQRLEEDGNDLITLHSYDNNDDLAITRRPEGNREFLVYDERRLRYKKFYGVAPGARIDEGYPADKRAVSLDRTAFVGLTLDTYDARLNHVRNRDGRGNVTSRFYDFYNRLISESDPNGNGTVRQYDDASHALTIARGSVDGDTGRLTTLLERTYDRFDEIGRRYQRTLDIKLDSDERAAVDPDDGQNSSYRTRFDAGSRQARMLDANGNSTSYTYDAANRRISATDALGNARTLTYDANSNLIRVTESELPGPGASGNPETYVSTFAYDEADRLTEEHILGLNGTSIDHATFFAYDSRNNRRLERDAENNFTLRAFDDLNRVVIQERFDGDPFQGMPTRLMRGEWEYDRNSRVTRESAFSDVTDAQSVQVARYSYDDLDRRIRMVYPDSDDPVDGSGNGPDGIFDRVEIRFDANSNLTGVTDQRGVVLANTFDPGNRPSVQDIARPPSVPGTVRQSLVYDALNRIVDASNDYARVDRSYDPLSRLAIETQSIRLDGSGFVNGWENPIQVAHEYDRQSNCIGLRVLDRASTDLAVARRFDRLNRTVEIGAQYFDTAMHGIARYTYLGTTRVQTKTLGNGALLTRTYDVKRRNGSHVWTGPGGVLAGFEYGYDRMDNALYERFLHDNGLFDHFLYNDRYEVTGVEYRSASPVPPVSPRTLFFYDDLFNRTQAGFGDPFAATANTLDSYSANRANEYERVQRNGRSFNQTHDAAGNPARLLVRPLTGRSPQADVLATLRWDAVKLLFDVDTGVTARQHYRYDVFRRRIVSLELDGVRIQSGSRRYIYDGWDDIEERIFEDGAKLQTAPSTLERIYVNGREIDEPLLAAIDRDGDGRLGGPIRRNERNAQADQEYYFLNNRMGSIMALLDAVQAGRVMEYYRYTVYGEPTVLPVVDIDQDGLEDTPLDLSDNFAPGPDRPSAVSGNFYFFTARRLDERTGLYYYRNRYYEARTGRFLGRDPMGFADARNLYQYAFNSPQTLTDPSGLKVTCIGIGGSFVAAAGANGYVYRCSDECGNYAWVLAVSGRLGVDVGIGVQGQDFDGGIDDFLAGANDVSYDWSLSLFIFSFGRTYDEDGNAEGTQGGLGPSYNPFQLLRSARLGFSVGAGGIAILDKDLSKLPCPQPAPVTPRPLRENPYGTVITRSDPGNSTDVCCCLKFGCLDEEGVPSYLEVRMVSVYTGSGRSINCEYACKANSSDYKIGYHADPIGMSYQCTPAENARWIDVYRKR